MSVYALPHIIIIARSPLHCTTVHSAAYFRTHRDFRQAIHSGRGLPDVRIGEAHRVLWAVAKLGRGVGQVDQQLVLAGREFYADVEAGVLAGHPVTRIVSYRKTLEFSARAVAAYQEQGPRVVEVRKPVVVHGDLEVQLRALHPGGRMDQPEPVAEPPANLGHAAAGHPAVQDVFQIAAVERIESLVCQLAERIPAADVPLRILFDVAGLAALRNKEVVLVIESLFRLDIFAPRAPVRVRREKAIVVRADAGFRDGAERFRRGQGLNAAPPGEETIKGPHPCNLTSASRNVLGSGPLRQILNEPKSLCHSPRDPEAPSGTLSVCVPTLHLAAIRPLSVSK